MIDGEITNARQFILEVRDLAKKYNCNFFIVTDGASAISNKGNEIVEKHRNLQIELDKEMGISPLDNWENERRIRR